MASQKPPLLGGASTSTPRKGPTIETQLRRLIERHQLARIEIDTRDGKRFTASAYPASYSPVVAERRRQAFATAGKTDFTIAESTAIHNKAVEDRLCHATAETITEAVADLAKALAAPGEADKRPGTRTAPG